MSTETLPPAAPQPGATKPPKAAGRIGFWLAVLIGFISVGVTVGVAELLAALGSLVGLTSTAASGSPLTGLGATFIQFTPEWLKEFAISIFGTFDKVALKGGMGITLVAMSGVLGLIARRNLRLAQIAFVVLGLVVIVAVYTRVGNSLIDVLPTVIGIAVGMYALDRLMQSRAGYRSTESDKADDRRKFIRLAAASAGLAVVTGGLSRLVPTSAGAEKSQAAAAADTAAAKVDRMPPLPAGASLDQPGITPFVTANADFYRIDTAFTVPRIDATTWELRIHGMVDKEITINYADLLARPLIERMVTLTCVSNEVGGDLAGNAVWQGALIRDLLKEAGPSADADMVMSRSADGFSVGTPLSVLLESDRDAIFAVTMNGAVLPFEHGFPVRMVVPGLYGFVSATKWVVELELTRFDKATSYWTDRGWSPMGPIKTASRIDVPTAFQKIPAGKFAIGGVAWAQHRGIASVEVQVDNGDWQPAKISTEATKDTWRQWAYVWDAVPGQHTIQVRATDETGAVQIQAPQGVLPDGATGYDSRVVTVS